MPFKALRLWVSAVLLAPILCVLPAGAATEEYTLKAAFLYNFALLTEWPEARTNTVKLCVLGKDPFGDELDRYAGRETPRGPIVVARIDSLREARSCQLLFIAASEHGRLAQIRDALGEKAPLTVTEANQLERRTAMIVLVPTGGRVGFEVNLTVARQAGLVLNPKLLRLAMEVY